MTPSPQQALALERIQKWRRSGEKQIFKLFGYAGTGKTTLARMAVAAEKRPVFTAYTGKAAAVLRSKGCIDAKNLHRLLYRSMNAPLEPDGEQFTPDNEHVPEPGLPLLEQGLKFDLDPTEEIHRATIVVIDEASMVDDRTLTDLLALEKPILALGDPVQLPPVGLRHASLTDGEPDAFLTDIHRQALDNPIIRLSMQARTGEPIDCGVYGDSHVIRLSLDAVAQTRAEQVLCGLNKTRRTLNAAMRRRRGHSGWLPEPDERLVCLRNQHSLGLLNGAVFVTRAVTTGRGRVSGRQMVGLTLEPEEGGEWIDFVCPADDFFVFFDFGYCLTVHKAQGSEWRTVLLVDEGFYFGVERRRWLYTGITRARDRLIIARRLR
jgi:exodeoxyribonuclease-5